MSRSRLSLRGRIILRTVALPALLLGLAASRAGASGFEKAVAWSGHYAGIANAATAAVVGPEALYFNPAGLANTERVEVGVNLSPMFAKLEGPMPVGSSAQNLHATTPRSVAPLIGMLASYRLAERWGVGLGYYVTGGLQADYNNLDYSGIVPGATLRPTVKADLGISEIALGTGYELAPGLRVGGAYRVLSVNASFASAKVLGANALQNAFFDDLKDTVSGGLRFGAQYQPKDARWGLGTTWRSRVDFTATGTVSARVDVAGAITDVPASPVSAKNALPQQAAIGGFYTFSPQWKLFTDYSWTEYSVDQKLDVTGSLGGVDISTAGDIAQGWRNLSIIRLGTEYSGVKDLALRAGYAYVSQVTPSERARATFVAPGPAHVFTLGLGRRLRGGMKLDAALEYSFAGGHGSNTSPIPALSDNIAGAEFHNDEFTIHTGLTYAF